MWRIRVAVALAVGLTASAEAGDKKFTAADVMAWDQKSQEFYFQVSIGMAAAIASQNDTGKARCINDWYFADPTKRASANAAIREAMLRFSSFRPAGVLLAYLEKKCGEMTF